MNRLALKLRFCAAFLLLGLWGADAQTAREQIAAVPERAGGIYHSYEYRPAAAAPAPDGYTPFYISHYGRHGSRWHASESVCRAAENPAQSRRSRCADAAGS